MINECLETFRGAKLGSEWFWNPLSWTLDQKKIHRFFMILWTYYFILVILHGRNGCEEDISLVMPGESFQSRLPDAWGWEEKLRQSKARQGGTDDPCIEDFLIIREVHSDWWTLAGICGPYRSRGGVELEDKFWAESWKNPVVFSILIFCWAECDRVLEWR